MDIGVISVRYARALIKSALSMKLEDQVYQEMQTLYKSYIDVPELRFTIDNPMLSKDKKQALLTTALGNNPSELSKKFIALVLKEAAETRDAIVEKAQDKAREEGARLLSDAKTQIENEKQNAIREIRGQVAELSVQIAEKVLKAKLSDDKAQMDLINRLLDEVSSDNK